MAGLGQFRGEWVPTAGTLVCCTIAEFHLDHGCRNTGYTPTEFHLAFNCGSAGAIVIHSLNWRSVKCRLQTRARFLKGVE